MSINFNSILIVDDDIDWCLELKAHFEKNTLFDVLSLAHDGKAAIEAIENLRPKIILLDLILPEYEGRDIIEHITTKMYDYHPIIYYISAVSSKKTKVRLMGYEHVAEYSVKPITPERVLFNTLLFIEARDNKNLVLKQESNDDFTAPQNNSTKFLNIDNIYIFTNKILDELGVESYKRSGRLLQAIIIEYLKVNEKKQRVILQEIYQSAGKTFDTPISKMNIDRSVRYAIGKAFERRRPFFDKLFPNGSVTNARFIKGVVDYIKARAESA